MDWYTPPRVDEILPIRSLKSLARIASWTLVQKTRNPANVNTAKKKKAALNNANEAQSSRT